MSNYVIVNGELYHHGVKGMKWGRRRYRNPDGTLTEAGKKRYGEEPEGYSEKKQIAQERTYNQRRHAKGKEKKQLKKQLIAQNKDAAKALNEYRKWEGSRKYSKRKAHDTVTSDFVAGPKVPGENARYVVKAANRKDPNRRAKNAVSIGSKVVAGVATAKLGNMAANYLWASGKVSESTARLINRGSGIVGGYLVGSAAGQTVRELRNEYRINRHDNAVDRAQG